MNNDPILRCAIVTGASRGIGRAIAKAFARDNMNVIIGYNGSKESAEETLKQCQSICPDRLFITVKADVSSEAGCQQLINAAIEHFGRIDVLVNNAGITRDNLLLRMDAADIDQVIDCDLKSVIYCCKWASKYMLKQRNGRIINISSVVGLHGNIGQVNYSAAKAGVIGVTKSLAKELASRNITVNAIAPGFIDTDMTSQMSDNAKELTLSQIPLKRIGSAEDVANAARFLAQDASSYITGQVLSVDGGLSI